MHTLIRQAASLHSTNPGAHIGHPHLETLTALQRGAAGDITAARKVRVFDIPFE